MTPNQPGKPVKMCNVDWNSFVMLACMTITRLNGAMKPTWNRAGRSQPVARARRLRAAQAGDQNHRATAQ